MVERARHLSGILINHIITTSSRFNRSICTQYDGIVRRITAQSETTEQLVQQQAFVENLHVKELVELRVNH